MNKLGDTKMKKIFLIFALFLLFLGQASAYDPKPVGENLSFAITSNNATSCNITTLETKTLIDLNYEMSRNGQTFSATILSGNLSETGDTCFNIECSDGVSKTTGQRCYTLTPNGEEATIGKAVFYIGLVSILIIFLIICLVSFVKFDNLLNRVGMIGLGYLFLIAITFIGWNMAQDFLTSSPFLIEMMRIIFFVLIVGAFPLLIGAFAWYLLMLFKIKEIQNLMDKGMSFDEAERRQGRKYK